MKPIRLILHSACLFASFVFHAGETPATDSKGAAVDQVAPSLHLLQGKWEGVDVLDQSHQKITVTIKDNSLNFFRDKDFWFSTTYTLTVETNPKRLHATVKESANGDAKGEVVGAIFKIEEETLTLASYGNDNENPSGDFSHYPSRYVLKKVRLHEPKNEEPSSRFQDDKSANCPEPQVIIPFRSLLCAKP